MHGANRSRRDADLCDPAALRAGEAEEVATVQHFAGHPRADDLVDAVEDAKRPKGPVTSRTVPDS